MAEQNGFPASTGIDLPGEAPGYVLTPTQKARLHQQYPNAYPFGSYYVGDAVESAIGQDDVAVTVRQRRTRVEAQPARRHEDTQTDTGKLVHRCAPVKLGQAPPLTGGERRAMTAGYLGVTTNPLGTAYYSFGATNYPIPVSGIPPTSPAYRLYTSVFTSVAPADNPGYVVDCFISQAGYGADAAAPVTRQVDDVLFQQPILPSPPSGY